MVRGIGFRDCGTQYHWRIRLPLLLILLISIAAGCGKSAANFTSAAAALRLDAVQRQLAALPCPPGVSAELWDVLTGELLSQLEKRASAQPLVTGPPLDDLSIVDDLTATEPTLGNIRLRWTYRNTGDYDQNSETNISDLTSVGLHFNKTPASGDWNNASVADGDLNHEVNISDVTPIGRCFLQTVTEYRVEYNASGAPGTEFTLFGSASFDASNPNANDWLIFEVTLPGAQSGYYRVVPYYFEERGIPGAPVYFGANQPPTAVLTADPQSGRTPMVVSFDASDSSDPEHTALTFSWDWEGDGVYDFDSGSTAALEHEYTEEGDYAPYVKVRDAKGAEATAEQRIVSHNWSIYEIETEVGASDAAIIGGKPAYLFARRDTEHPPTEPLILCYARSKVAVPKSASDWELSVLRPAELEGDSWISTAMHEQQLFELDNRPAVYHWIGEPRFEWYLAHATVTEPSGPDDWVISKVSDSGEGPFGTSASAFVVDGRPFCVYQRSDQPKLMLARGLVAEPQGPEYWEITEVTTWGDEDSSSGGPVVAGFVGGNLCVAYSKMPEADFNYLVCGSLAPSGPSDWETIPVDTEGYSGPAELRSVDDYSYISYGWSDGAGNLEIRLARALTPTPETPADWNSVTALVTDNYTGRELVLTEQGPVMMTSVKRTNGYWQLLALYPAEPGFEALDRPWVAEEVNPSLMEDNSSYQELLYIDGWLICIYSDWWTFPGEGHSLNCAIANLPAHYSN